MNLRCIIFTLLAYFNIQPGVAQSPYFREITDREGLPSMVVYDIYQSQKGYIWLGTEAGISRYDGIKFKTYYVNNSQGRALINIQEDSQGNIYCMNFLGQLFKIQNDEVKPVALPKDVSKKRLRTYFIDQADNLWIGDEKVYFKAKNKNWKTLNIPKTYTTNSIQQDKNGDIWILSYHNRIYKVNAKLEILQTISPPEYVLTFRINSKNLLAISLENKKIYRYDLQTQKWSKVWQKIQDEVLGRTLDFHLDKQGNAWIPTSEGVIHYRPKNNEAKTFIEGVLISDFIQDREGNYWFSSVGQGLFLLSNLEGVHFNRANSLLNFEQIECFEEDHLGNLYIGTNGNHLFYLNTQEDKLSISYKLTKGAVECMFLDKKRQKLYVENDLLTVFDVTNGNKIK